MDTEEYLSKLKNLRNDIHQIENIQDTLSFLEKTNSVEFHTQIGHGIDDQYRSICFSGELEELKLVLTDYFKQKIERQREKLKEVYGIND